jgi:hypothetical protein
VCFIKGQKRHCVGLVLEKVAACSVGAPRGHAGRRPAPPPASAAGGGRMSDKGAGCVFVVKRLVAGSPAARYAFVLAFILFFVSICTFVLVEHFFVFFTRFKKKIVRKYKY